MRKRPAEGVGAVDEDRGQSECGASAAEAKVRSQSDAATRPYTAWIKIEPGNRRLPARPSRVSRGLWARLSRHVAACLRQRVGSIPNLRQVVRALNAEMRLAGGSIADVEAALHVALLQHPDLDLLDRIDVVTRRLHSDALLERMLGWVEETESNPSDLRG